jgi:SAM-dependent methyltransferase
MQATPTWHHGLIADWWANFNVEGPEIECYGRFVADGQPALDAGCGAGRLLLPWLRAGFDVDGCDVSADMVARCRERAAAERFAPTLFVQPLHELEPPRRYRTIVVCGVFGLGSTRAQDELALRRLHAALEPGGTLILDNVLPYVNEALWRRWPAAGRADLPTPWPDEPDRRTASDGSEYALRSRVLELDPLDQSVRMAIRAEKSHDGRVLAAEEHELSMRMWFCHELAMALRGAGFDPVDLRGGYEDREPTPADDVVVFLARKPH